MTKEYSNDDITIVWKPEKCVHAAVCISTLPNVYNPTARPWIKIENASTQALILQIKQCPSGALSFYMNDEKNEDKQ